MIIKVNPGSGLVEVGPGPAGVAHAKQNILQLILDAGLDLDDVRVERNPEEDGNGRYCFLLLATGSDGKEYQCEVDMPGIDLAKVRYTGTKNQDIFKFPRMYIDGSSWIWSIGKGVIGRSLDGFYAREAEAEEKRMREETLDNQEQSS